MSSKIKFIDSSLSLAFFQDWTISFSVMPEITISPYNSGFKFDIFRPRPKKTILLSLHSSCKSSEVSFSNVLKTKEFSPLEPDVSENKFYVANVGDIKEK